LAKFGITPDSALVLLTEDAWMVVIYPRDL